MNMANKAIKVLGLSGEYRPTSKCGMLVNLALDIAKENGAEIYFWDLDVKPLPLVGEEGCWDNQNVKEFQELATEMDAFLIASPEYHGTMSGAMKNTFDWLYTKHVKGKVFGLMSTLGGVTNSNTLNHMRIMLRWIHGWPVPEQLAIGNVKEAFDDDGKLVDPKIVERLNSVVISTLENSKKLS
ncbi:MAG: NADPH-dependent FMN reductase [Euryarchaeota archaeon]|jgi:NAD(P)H-dependent FMN reductase|nr:NADPH-dependent FMN reductase [Euryarchaeota archaeon]|tara:strand:- start:5145 stop:5696 length:552 start_codon:yes stop_codon:yes gene_type:complete